MTPSEVLVVAVTSAAIYVFGGFCIFRTKILVEWGRRNYAKGKFTQAWPFSSIVMKPWYPTYVRAAGIIIWLATLVADYLVLRGHR